MMDKRLRLCAALLSAAMLLSGCGIRTRVLPAQEAAQTAQDGTGSALTGGHQADAPGDAANAGPAENGASLSAEPDPNAPSEHDPDARRREYQEHAGAELTEGEARTLVLTGGSGRDVIGEEEQPSADAAQEADEASLTAREILSRQEAEQLGISREAPRADTVYQFYQTLLASKVGSLFECKRLYVYWETPVDYQTVYRTSAEHSVILLAGGYDVAAKRQEDALMVDDGWISRKAPGCIVKCVDASVLGSGVRSGREARTVLAALLARPGWQAMDAVRAQKVLVLSAELLDTRWGQLAAALYMAKTMYPAEMADVDPDEALRLLAQEATGADISGCFAWTQKENGL
ncbi:MAG: hypothetical protein ACI4O7_14010 [Aristaeellaceae bacterium]